MAHELALDNATFRLIDAAPAWTRYLVLDFRFTGQKALPRKTMLRSSDDRCHNGGWV